MPSSTHEKVRLVGFSGSLRKASYTTAVIRTLQEHMPSDVILDVRSIADIPLYNQDEDGAAAAPAVSELRHAVAECDGLVAVSPEYNNGMSGVMKNAIDWLSRPALRSPLAGKPVLTMTASPGMVGGVRAHYQLREAFSAALARVVVGREVVICAVGEKVIDHRLVDAATLAFALDAISNFLHEIALLRAGRRALAQRQELDSIDG